MAETSLPNPGSTTIYFIVITIVLIAYTIFNIKKAQTYSNISASSETRPINIIYILTIIIGSYFINVAVSKAMCSSQSIQWGYVLLITLLPWVIVFVTLYGILYLFPGWIAPFSNTIGYFVIGLLGVEKTYDNIFKTGEEASENPELIKAIANMNSNKTKFVNQISTNIAEFIDFFTSMKSALKSDIVIPDTPNNNAAGLKLDANGQSFDTTGPNFNATSPSFDAAGINDAAAGTSFNAAGPKVDDDTSETKITIGGAPENVKNRLSDFSSFFRRQPTTNVASVAPEIDSTTNETNVDHLLKLYQLLVIKQFIGKMVWYILAGILICSISYNLIINMNCEKSVEELTKDFETAKAKNTETTLNIAPPPITAPVGVALNSSSTSDLTSGLTQKFGTQ